METSQIFQCGPILGNLAWGTRANFEALDHDVCSWHVWISVEEIVGTSRANGAIIKTHDTI